ncbi:MAG TPA: GNAT family N-acetyltransferase [Streptosporangiaceae bacterium]|nr:GNAT family N-acetyltransferase [Streptosporangiaceae bacterium]
MDRGEVLIRPYRPDDLDDLYRICLLTADSGQDATRLYGDPQLPGQIFAAPYGMFQPSLAFIAEDEAGAAGYIVGALDSQEFEKTLERSWWPALRQRYPEPSGESGQWTRDQFFANVIHHPWPTPDELAGPYPSHLHINLLPRLQGRGLGRRLIGTLAGALRDAGSPGVHLNVTPTNQRAAEFYAHLGFTGHPAGDTRLFTMDLRAQ